MADLNIPKINVEEEDLGQNQVSQSETPEVGNEEELVKNASLLNPRRKKILLIAGGVFLAFLLLVILPLMIVFAKARTLQRQVVKASEVVSTQDVKRMKEEIENTRKGVVSFKRTYRAIAHLKLVPFFGGFVRDGQHALNAAEHALNAADLTLSALEPYGDILGLKNGESETSLTGGEKTAQDRIDFVIKSLPDLTPKLDEIASEMALVKEEVNQINPDRYPVRFAGREVRSKVARGKDVVNQSTDLVTSAKPLLEKAPYLLGIEGEREYLILFQNDKELRPTGGFMTAYSLSTVKEGKFEPVASSDIYSLDLTYKPDIKAPDPVIKYLKGPYVLQKNFRIRDINWSPDFSQSMSVFTKEADEVGLSGYDGVIAVDTHLLVNLLNALGPIGVPGFGNYSTENHPDCNCPQVIYELESFADVEGPIVWDPISGEIVYRPPNSDNRKKIIGPLMNSILANALGQPKEKLADLFKAVFKSVNEKHVLFYLFDEEAQASVEAFGIAGRIKGYEGDYLHINDANLGGRKSNLYITQQVDQLIEVSKDGKVTKTVTITYNNPAPHDGWLNSVLPNWVRVYVPLGSRLVDSSGLEDMEDPYEDLGKTVFAGFFELRPQGIAKVTLTYELPFKVDKNYQLLIQKQPGTDLPLHSIKIGKTEEELFLPSDKEFKFRI